MQGESEIRQVRSYQTPFDRTRFLCRWAVGDPARRLFLSMKNNIGPDSAGLAFQIESATFPSAAGELPTSYLRWDLDPDTTTADEVMRAQTPEHKSTLREAEEWLEEVLIEPALAGGSSGWRLTRAFPARPSDALPSH